MKKGVWHINVDNTETIWKQIWKDFLEATKGTNTDLKAGLDKLIDPEHPAIRIRRNFLEWGTRHEELSPQGPRVIIPMTTECLASIDRKLIGTMEHNASAMAKVITFEEGYINLMQAEEDTKHVVF